MPLSSLRTSSQLRTRDLFKDLCAARVQGQADLTCSPPDLHLWKVNGFNTDYFS